MNSNKISEFRIKFVKALSEDSNASSVDTKDINRLKVSDEYVLCFIHWRRGDVDAAVKLALHVLKWRKENDINGITTEEMDSELLKRGVVFVHGRALDDTRLVYFIGRHQTKEIKADVQRILCLWLERLHHQETGKHVTFVLDVSKTGMSNVDLGGIRFLMDCFITYFPDMLERIIILEMPWIMNAVWKIVKQWMTEEQRKRTAFISFKELKQFIAPDNILSYMGGQDEWMYEYPPPADSIPCLTELPNYEQDEISLQGEDEEEYAVNDVEITLTETKDISEIVPETDGPQTELVHRRKGLESSDSNHLLNVSHPRPLMNGLVSDAREQKEVIPPDTTPLNATLHAPISGINLQSLLVLSPVAEVTFDEETKDQKTGKYQSFFTLTNPNQTGQVAYKIKTNFPDRYHVKPSSGCVEAGESVKIRLNLSPGHEVTKDRFLILYAKKDDDTELADFWKMHTSKDQHREYRIRVKFNNSSTTSTAITSPPKQMVHPLQNVSIPEVETSPPTDVEVEKLKKDLGVIKNKLNVVESNTNCLRSKFHYSLGLNCVLLLCIFYAIHQLSLITVLVHYDHTPKNL